jgi:hypothetical protein
MFKQNLRASRPEPLRVPGTIHAGTGWDLCYGIAAYNESCEAVIGPTVS